MESLKNLKELGGTKTIHTPSPLHFNSKRNIPVWSARFSPLHQLIPHSIYSRFLLHTPPSITLYYKLNHPSLPHPAHGSGELCPRPHVICARRPRPSSAPRAFAPATSSARAAAALRAGRAPVPSATRPRSGRRRRPCPSRRRRAPGPRRRPSPLRRRRAPGRPRAPPLCAAASLGPAAPPLPSAPRPGSGRRRRPCAPCRCRAPGPPPPTIVRSVASSTRGGGGGEAGWHGDGRGADLRASTTSATPATSARLAPPPVLSLLSVRARQRLGAIGRAHTDGRRGDVSLTSKVELWRLSSTVEV